MHEPPVHPSDPVPPRLLLNLFDLLATTIQSLFNSSLVNGNVPVCFKHAVAQQNVDCTVLSIYRPITKSKVLEKVVLSQLIFPYLDANAVPVMF